MLTRLKVSGFKNLVDVDVSLSPFTCVVGTNGVGKSNLFDAISFLSALPRLRTHNQKLIVAAMQMALKNVCAQRSYRVAMRRQSFSNTRRLRGTAWR